MNTHRTDSQPDPLHSVTPGARALAPLSTKELADACRELDARGVKYSVIKGVPVVQQGFSAPRTERNLFDQCLELNRQAVVRSPKSVPHQPGT